MGRLASIDVFRALTMFLMIFVNDLWSLQGVPQWLQHTQAMEDGMGLSDVVFPAFLFIVGLSIPFAITGRIRKGQSDQTILAHILFRGIALLVMGFFHVNLGNYSDVALLPRTVWQILLTISFFLIWLDYPRQQNKKWIFQGLGVALLAFLAIVYRGGTAEQPQSLQPHWWGILGLIGWAYLLSGVIYLFSKGSLIVNAIAFAFFLLFNIAAQSGWLDFLQPIREYIWIVGDGSLPALVMAGVLAAQLYHANKNIFLPFILLSAACVAAGFMLRPYFIISKILATPSWTLICIGISLAVFTLLIYITDVKKKEHSFSIIKPAGTATLTAYLLPYIHYALYSMIGITLPLVLRTGWVGILKSLLYALLIILITRLLEKKRLKLKI
ncbi:MAG: DUF5009 domain-containing protein [Chitinophagaceae bacterium]|nr:DUF5009 domain-containing protein [Chitinophagaceae bacterium]